MFSRFGFHESRVRRSVVESSAEEPRRANQPGDGEAGSGPPADEEVAAGHAHPASMPLGDDADPDARVEDTPELIGGDCPAPATDRLPATEGPAAQPQESAPELPESPLAEPPRSDTSDAVADSNPASPPTASVATPPVPLNEAAELPALAARRAGQSLAPPAARRKTGGFTAEQRLLLLDTWLRSGLAAGDFADLVGLSKHTLYAWKKRFDQQGPAGLADQPRGTRKGSRMPDISRRAILMMKEAHPDWGCQRISDMLMRGPALPASASAVARVLKEAGYQTLETPTRPHRDKVRRFERARPNQLWQTDLFTFVLKRQNRRLHLVAFMDDHSRFIVSYGLHASASTALVLEALEAGIAAYGPPEEVLTDNGPQYKTWRGKSQFTKQLEKRGIRQLVARPRRPQTLGKIERFWGTMWRECLQASLFVDLQDARTRIGLFVDYYNFQRVHRGIGGLVPADRFFSASTQMLETLKQRVAANALQLARHGPPHKPFYVAGQVDGQGFSVHAEGQRLILRRDSGQREEVTLHDRLPTPHPDCQPDLPTPVCPQAAPPSAAGEPAAAPPAPPGESPLDQLNDEADPKQEKGGA